MAIAASHSLIRAAHGTESCRGCGEERVRQPHLEVRAFRYASRILSLPT
jgi:hypothetical protein